MSDHTPLPWRVDTDANVFGPDGERLLVVGFSLPCGNHPQASEAEANTRFIVACANGYERHTRAVCQRILVILAGAGFCTPEEGYGSNFEWAMSDLRAALHTPRLGVPAEAEAPRTGEHTRATSDSESLAVEACRQLAFVLRTMPPPKLGDWNWPQLAEQCEEAVAGAGEFVSLGRAEVEQVHRALAFYSDPEMYEVFIYAGTEAADEESGPTVLSERGQLARSALALLDRGGPTPVPSPHCPSCGQPNADHAPEVHEGVGAVLVCPKPLLEGAPNA